jgi:chromosome partitioning protein
MLNLREGADWSGVSTETLWSGVMASPHEFHHLPPRFKESAKAGVAAPSTNRFLDHAAMRRLSPPAKRKCFTVGIQKGGVGKTMIALNLAATWATAGLRVLYLDLDPQASATNFLLPPEADYDRLLTSLEVCLQPELTFATAATTTRFAGLDLVASKPAIRKTDPLLRDMGALAFLESRLANAPYDCIIFDVPPSLNELIMGAYCLSDEILMPILPDIWSIESAVLTIANVEEELALHNRPVPLIRLIRNRFRPGRIASAEAQEMLESELAGRLLPHCIPETAAIQNLVNDGKTALQGGSAPLREIFLKLSATLWHTGEPHAQTA